MESKGEGKGTIVSFTVPVFTGLVSKSYFDSQDSLDESCDKPLVLVVEDDPAICSIIEDILRQHNFVTISTDTADDAVAMARRHHPKIVTIDFGLLAREHAVLQDGCDILRVLSQDNQTKDIKFIIISGYDDPIKARICEERLDIQPEFIEKPFSAGILVEKIRALISVNEHN